MKIFGLIKSRLQNLQNESYSLEEHFDLLIMKDFCKTSASGLHMEYLLKNVNMMTLVEKDLEELDSKNYFRDALFICYISILIIYIYV